MRTLEYTYCFLIRDSLSKWLSELMGLGRRVEYELVRYELKHKPIATGNADSGLPTSDRV